MHKIFLGVSLLLLIAGCSGADGDDQIVLQNGSHRTGTLQGCLNGGCQFNGGAIPQATIAWVGLHQAQSSPPQPNDSAVGEIRLNDHSVHPGLMTAIDPKRVITTLGSYDRREVAWVYLAHPEQTASDVRSTASSAPTSSSDGRVVHFDIDIAVTAHQHIQNRTGAGVSVEDDSVDWTGSWRNVALRILPGPDGAPFAVVPVLPFPTGIVQAWAKFTYNDPPTIYQPTNCKGELPTQTYTGQLSLIIYLKLGGTRNKISFQGQAQDAGMAFDEAFDAAGKARCHPHDSVSTPGFFPFRTPDGIDFVPGVLTLDWFLTSPSAAEIPFPLDQILAGKSFTLETGNQSRSSPTIGSGVASGDGQTVNEAVRVSFTAR